MKILLNKKINTGITLIALVITIIILLILAGITISQLTGSGLFGNSKLAKEKYENAQAHEQTEIAKFTNKIDEYIDGNRNISEDRIREIIREEIADNSQTITKTTLFTGELTDQNNTGTFTENASNYDMFIVTFTFNGDEGYENYIVWASDLGVDHRAARSADSSTNYYCIFRYKITNTNVQITHKFSNNVSGKLIRVVGIKF